MFFIMDDVKFDHKKQNRDVEVPMRLNFKETKKELRKPTFAYWQWLLKRTPSKKWSKNWWEKLIDHPFKYIGNSSEYNIHMWQASSSYKVLNKHMHYYYMKIIRIFEHVQYHLYFYNTKITKSSFRTFHTHTLNPY